MKASAGKIGTAYAVEELEAKVSALEATIKELIQRIDKLEVEVKSKSNAKTTAKKTTTATKK